MHFSKPKCWFETFDNVGSTLASAVHADERHGSWLRPLCSDLEPLRIQEILGVVVPHAARRRRRRRLNLPQPSDRAWVYP